MAAARVKGPTGEAGSQRRCAEIRFLRRQGEVGRIQTGYLIQEGTLF